MTRRIAPITISIGSHSAKSTLVTGSVPVSEGVPPPPNPPPENDDPPNPVPPTKKTMSANLSHIQGRTGVRNSRVTSIASLKSSIANISFK